MQHTVCCARIFVSVKNDLKVHIMSQMFIKVILAIAVLLAFIVPGYILRKINMVDGGAKRALSAILLYVCQPALIISSFCVFTDEEWLVIEQLGSVALVKDFVIAALISLIAMIAVFGVCKLVFIKYKNRDRANIYSYVAVFSNCGFLGVPFIEILTDGSILAVMYLMIFNLVFALVVWTLGVWLLTGDRHNISIKKVLLNPSIISMIVALLLFFVPQINFFMFDGVSELQIFPEYLSTMTAPLSMIIVGISMAEIPLKELFTDGGAYIAGALRLIAAPVVTFIIALLFRFMCADFLGSTPQVEYVYLAPVIAMAMSPAATVVAMAEQYQKGGRTATIAFITNTLLSIVTVPLILMAVLQLWELIP